MEIPRIQPGSNSGPADLANFSPLPPGWRSPSSSVPQRPSPASYMRPPAGGQGSLPYGVGRGYGPTPPPPPPPPPTQSGARQSGAVPPRPLPGQCPPPGVIQQSQLRRGPVIITRGGSDDGDSHSEGSSESGGSSPPRRISPDEEEGPAPQVEEVHSDQLPIQGEDQYHFLRSLTISRDHTGASRYQDDLVSVLRDGDKQDGDKEDDDRKNGDRVILPYLTTVQVDRLVVDARARVRAAVARKPQYERPKHDPQAQRRYLSSIDMKPDAGRTPPFTWTDGPTDGEAPTPQEDTRLHEIAAQIQKLQELYSALCSTKVQTLHKIEKSDTVFLEEPSWVSAGSKRPDIPGQSQDILLLKGNSPVADEDQYLQQRPDVAFVVYKYYEASYQAKEIAAARKSGTRLPVPKPVRETVRLWSQKMMAAVDIFLKSHPTFESDFPRWQTKRPIDSPFLFWYYYRSSGKLEAMPEPHRTQMQLLADWINQSYGHVYQEAEALLARGKVSPAVMPFLVWPRDVLVSRGGTDVRGFVVKSWSLEDFEWADEAPKWVARAWSYGLGVPFHQVEGRFEIDPKFDEDHVEVDIAKLDVLPLKLMDKEVRDRLERRGLTMWACRNKSLVAYDGSSGDEALSQGERYMIDFKTYTQLHSDSPMFKLRYPYLAGVNWKPMPPELVDRDEPPGAPELLAFPSTIVGYNLRLKAWQDLQVDRIQKVDWNKTAFEHLVIDPDTKDLIEALVTTKLEADQSTDLIQGKGNGLVILLHGGPGTGKTLTAESVAEFAEKPLFRVTSGDVGTKPEAVEKYLESVLHLGKIWGCVVLFDEADVFLEQRTLTDLERNALVSVFLRVLEYYEGILILTSNRVGTFDEAFKSRIQLALHYEALDKSQRRQIWKNFLDRLRKLEAAATAGEESPAPVLAPTTNGKGKEPCWNADADASSRAAPAHTTTAPTTPAAPGIDFDDIELHLTELAEQEMNGRQIRNAITTARQLARFKKSKMRYTHLQHALKVANKFETYLRDVNEGANDDAIARGERWR